MWRFFVHIRPVFKIPPFPVFFCRQRGKTPLCQAAHSRPSVLIKAEGRCPLIDNKKRKNKKIAAFSQFSINRSPWIDD